MSVELDCAGGGGNGLLGSSVLRLASALPDCGDGGTFENQKSQLRATIPRTTKTYLELPIERLALGSDGTAREQVTK